MMKCNSKVVSSGEMKRQKGRGKVGGSEKGRKCNSKCELIGRRRCVYLFIFKNRENKSFKRENK